MSRGSFFRASVSIDTAKPPGTSTPKNPPETLTETAAKILTGEAFCYSPNLSWFLLAAGTWCIFPYDLEGRHNIDDEHDSNETAVMRRIVFHRLVINHSLALAYIGFWHWALYVRGICSRPYVPNRVYKPSKVLHNVFYTVLGILQWTIVEGAFLYLYRTGKLPYVDATTDPATIAQTLVLSVLIPPFRDVHFYFAHRMIHLRPLFKYVHSLHHRNTDTEPFSGLAMHPVEHMYYFTCYGPLLVLPLVFGWVLSPFLVFWMGVHLVISPAASHSGYEDHFSADLGHYLHHRYCECNYSGGINFDAYFGTHRATLAEARAPPAGESSPSLPPPPSDRKSSLGVPDQPDYELGVCALVVWAVRAHNNTRDDHRSPGWIAFVATVGPALWAVALALVNAPKAISRKKACLAPFDRDSPASLGLHLGLGILLGVLPATHLLFLVLQ